MEGAFHPLRLGILRLLSEDELTNEELAQALGVASGKLYFHTKMLLTSGLIEAAGTRQKGPITEKLYRSAAQRFVAATSDTSDGASLVNAVMAGLALYHNSRQQTPDLTETPGYHLVVSIHPDRMREFLDRLQQMAADFAASGSADTEPRAAALTMLIHTLPALSRGGDVS